MPHIFYIPKPLKAGGNYQRPKLLVTKYIPKFHESYDFSFTLGPSPWTLPHVMHATPQHPITAIQICTYIWSNPHRKRNDDCNSLRWACSTMHASCEDVGMPCRILVVGCAGQYGVLTHQTIIDYYCTIRANPNQYSLATNSFSVCLEPMWTTVWREPRSLSNLMRKHGIFITL